MMPYSPARLLIDPKARGYCRLPYPDHPKGCPNFDRRANCPPKAPRLAEVLDLDEPTFLIWTIFNLAGHVKAMRAKHPDWSDRQLRCCLYWQGTARAALRREIEIFNADHIGRLILDCPEGAGCDVTASMALLGVSLEWPPVTQTVHVAAAGTGLIRSPGQLDMWGGP